MAAAARAATGMRRGAIQRRVSVAAGGGGDRQELEAVGALHGSTSVGAPPCGSGGGGQPP